MLVGARAAHVEIGERIRAFGPEPMHGVTIVAHGSSDHAATYGRHLLVGITNDTTGELAEAAGAVIELGGEEHAVPATKTVTTQAPVLPAALREDAGRHGTAIAAWRGAGIDEAELAAWEA